MARYRSYRDLDWPLLLITLIICGLGVLQIYSATRDTHWEDAWWKQLIWIGIALALMWVVTSIDYHTLLGQIPLLYTLSVTALVGVLLVGRLVFGSRRWIRILGVNLQVSEFVKLVIILVVARYVSELRSDEIKPRDLLKLGGLVGIPAMLVISQPDLGTGLTYLPILAVGILIAGVQWRYLAIVALVGALTLPVGWYLLKDYQRQRLVTFLDPSGDPRGAGYQVIQSKIAVGDGGVWGRGVTRGTQTQLRFLPCHAHRSHLLVIRGGAWVRRCSGGVRSVFLAVDADCSKCPDGPGPGRHVCLYGRGRVAAVPCAGERGDGGGAHASDGNSFAAHEFGRLEHVFGIYDAGAGEQRPAPAVCELI